jgi:hypothetical protein
MWSNTTITANFITNPFPAIAGTYSGNFNEEISPGLMESGHADVRIRTDGTFTGAILFRAQRFPIAGKLQFDADFKDPDAVNATFTAAANRSVSGHIRFPSDGAGNLLPEPTLAMTIGNVTFPTVTLELSSTTLPTPDSLTLP